MKESVLISDTCTNDMKETNDIGWDNDTLRFEWTQWTRVRPTVIHIVNDLPVHAVTGFECLRFCFICLSALQFRMLRIPHSLLKRV